MKVSALIKRFRNKADDRAEPFLWDDEDVVEFLNNAMDEACIRARMLMDKATSAICTVPLTVGQVDYQLDKRVIEVVHARIDGVVDPLSRIDYDVLVENRRPQPSSANTGRPCGYAISGLPAGGLTLTLDKAPATGFTPLRLEVKRLQLTPLRVPTGPSDDDTPEIAEAYHPKLLHWMMKEAFETRDADSGNAQIAALHDAKFTQAFGVRPDANVARKRLKHRPAYTQPDIGSSGYRRLGRYNPSADD